MVTALVAVTELRRRLRDRSLLITALVAPFGLAAIMGLAFHPSSGGALVRIGLVDSASSPTGRAIVAGGLRAAALPPEIGVRPVISRAELFRDMKAGRLAGGVIVPASFGRPGPENRNDLPFLTTSPNAALAGPAAADVERAILSRLAVGRLADRVAYHTSLEPAGLDSRALGAASMAPSVSFADEGRGGAQSLIGYFAPSMAIVFLFIGVGAVARSILAERQTGTVARLAAAPVRAAAVVTGKLAGLLLVALVGILVLWGATTLAFGAEWGQPGPVAVMCVITAVSISGLALLVTGFARDEGQADTATLVIGMVLALLGGNFFPPGSLPTFLADLSRATPNGWALQGFGSLSLDRAGWSAVVGPVLALSVFTALCIGASAPRLRNLLVSR